MELGLHLANFTFTGGPPTLASDIAGLARSAEQAGFTRVTVMDHLWQIRGVGPEADPMLEAYTTLGYLAAATERVQLHTLVTGVVYREPGLLAKAVTTLDVLSGGRAGLGIGAAWNEDESLGLGLPFPPTAERFERLEEAIQICLQMWSNSEEAFDGQHYRLGRTLGSPPNLSTPRPRLMIGGSGERKTLRLVARYADACNIFPGPEAARKLDVLRAHCEAESRDYDTIEKTTIASYDPAAGAGPLLEGLRAQHELGFTATYVMIAGPEPLAELDAFANDIIPEISTW
jgi:alkanesulfonate monooxygenase